MLDLETENKFFKLGYQLLGGLDEAGRGPLAGPVVAACVVIGPDFKIEPGDLELVTDSKKLSAKKREIIFKAIREKVLAVEIGVVDHEDIDKINILQASFLAMRRAIKKLKVDPDYILLDGGFKIPKLIKPQTAIIKGDTKVWVIAAASIIAKVSRDWIMTEMDKEYPEYLFAKHKGYGTKEHLAMIAKHGPCPIHRRSFAPIKNYKQS
ncbi:MAG TPA: ribonuclease HII [Candidatus Saccharimonadales bacterium]|nr:ribonuclease HII [Candidatus Saccharimonadales bacterium]